MEKDNVVEPVIKLSRGRKTKIKTVAVADVRTEEVITKNTNTIDNVNLEEKIQERDNQFLDKYENIKMKNEEKRLSLIKEAEENPSFMTVLSNVTKGLFIIYNKRANEISNPFIFIVDNFSKIIFALVNILIPMAITYSVYNTEGFKSLLPVNSNYANLIGYGSLITLFVFSAFAWLSCYAFGKSLINTSKKGIKNLEEIGKHGVKEND